MHTTRRVLLAALIASLGSLLLAPVTEAAAPAIPTFQSLPPVARIFPNTYPSPACGPYTVVVDYTDPDGASDLQHTYLQIRGDGASQTIMYANLASPVQWDGEGNHLTNLGATKTAIPNGYRVTYTFQIKNTWTPSTNVRFEAFSLDKGNVGNAHQTHAWTGSYDNNLRISDARKVNLVDNDLDGYYSSVRIEANADTSLSSASVLMLLYRRDSAAGGSPNYIGDTGHFSTSGATVDYTGIECTVTTRGVYDFAWEIYAGGWYIASRWVDADADISNIPMEPASEDLPVTLAHPAQEFFDDFNYDSSVDARLGAFGWSVRDYPGGPGVGGASWKKERITFLNDPDNPQQKLMRLSCKTSGTGATTEQAEIDSSRLFFTGTYAVRVRLRDTTFYGPANDGVVQAPLFTIGSGPAPSDYTEVDFEYLPNDFWGSRSGPAMYWTTWETTTDSVSNSAATSYDGWHTLLVQVTGGQVKYYVDGSLKTTHGGNYYPDSPMFIALNLWFGSLNTTSSQPREWAYDVDWVWHGSGAAYTTSQVEYLVSDYRSRSVDHLDSFSLAPTNIALSNASVAENQESGAIVGQLTATDADNSSMFLYSLVSGEGDADNARFSITNNMLKTAGPFNFEARNNYSVRVRVTDPRGMSYEKSFAIAVSDQAEQAFGTTAISGHPASGGFLQWTCEAGYAYQVQYSDTLETGDWHDIGPARVWANGDPVMSHDDTTAVGLIRRFYRIVRTPLP